MQLRVQRQLARLSCATVRATAAAAVTIAARRCSTTPTDAAQQQEEQSATTATTTAITQATSTSVTAATAATAADKSVVQPLPQPASTPGGVDYTEHLAREADVDEWRRRHVPRATAAQRRGDVPTAAELSVTGGDVTSAMTSDSNNSKDSEGAATTQDKRATEAARWWRPVTRQRASGMMATIYDRDKRLLDGMMVPELHDTPTPHHPEELSFATSGFFVPHANMHFDEIHARQRRLPAAPPFDPALDDYGSNDGEEGDDGENDGKEHAGKLLGGGGGGAASDMDDGFLDGYMDMRVLTDIQRAADADRKRLEAFANPVTVQDEVEYLLAASRPRGTGGGGTTSSNDAAVLQQRREFNGFVHWGLLHQAHMLLEHELDTKHAHECVNRYLRDLDLFVHWLAHEKVRAHLRRKLGADLHGKFDKTMALTMALYTRAKVQVYEDDAIGALKTLVQAVALLSEAANLKLARHRTMYGAVLLVRGMVHCRLKAYTNADDDLTRALAFVRPSRTATLYQLRAEAREALGRLEEARADEERAAEMWEKADVVWPGMLGTARKFVT